ncbi:MAG: hypothetical protein L0Z55_10480 [Planctomycetes bacterium]|nr:hypothetical protein [Planctomycetota bacterium]
MAIELVPLLEKIVASGDVGTLVLGKGNRARRLTFTGKDAHLIDAGRECRFVPGQALFENDRVSSAVFDEIVLALRATPQSLARLLLKRGLIAEEEAAPLLQRELIEESLHAIFFGAAEHFTFERGNVPEELLQRGAEGWQLPAQKLIDAIRVRFRERLEIAAVFPSADEVLAISEEGKSLLERGDNWLFSQLAVALNGTRTIKDVVAETYFYPHLSYQVLAAAVRQGWVKKTRFPEFAALRPSEAALESVPAIIAKMEEAVDMAQADEPLRRRLAAFYLRAGMVDRAIEQYCLLGDRHRARGETAAALTCYQEALRWDPNSLVLKKQLVDVNMEAAERARAARNDADERRCIGEALRYRKDDLELYLRAIRTFEGDEERILQVLPRMIETMEEDDRRDLALRFLARLQESFPNSTGIRRKHVNVLLDYGNKDAAIREIEYLAGIHLDRGERAEAQALYQKIAVLDPKRRDAREQVERLEPKKKTPGIKAWRPSTLFAVLLVMMLPVVAYQFYAYGIYVELDRKAYALGDAPVPEMGTRAHQIYRAQTREVLRELRSFSRLHVISIWGGVCREIADDLDARLAFMDRQLDESLTRLWERAEEAKLRGRPLEASNYLKQLIAKGGNTRWETEASAAIAEIENYETQATELLRRARVAMASRGHEESFLLGRRILTEFPRSSAAREVSLPIVVESKPSQAIVQSGQMILGTTPLLLTMNPARPLCLVITRPGFEDAELLIEDPNSHVIQVVMEQFKPSD